MCAQTCGAGVRSWVDEGGGFRVRRGVGEVGSFGVVWFHMLVFREEHVCDGNGEEAGAVDESGGCDCCGGWGCGRGCGYGVGSRGGVMFERSDGRVKSGFTAKRLESAFEVGH